MRKLEIELRNGPALPTKLIDKISGRWIELNPMNERLVRKEIGVRLDAERVRKGGVIVERILEEAAEGRIYTTLQFAEKFENTGGLGGTDTIRDRISVLATKGYVKFVRDGSPFGFPHPTTSRFGYLCVEGHGRRPLPRRRSTPRPGKYPGRSSPFAPSTFKSPHTGAPLPDENPDQWDYQEECRMNSGLPCAGLRTIQLGELGTSFPTNPRRSYAPPPAVAQNQLGRAFPTSPAALRGIGSRAPRNQLGKQRLSQPFPT